MIAIPDKSPVLAAPPDHLMTFHPPDRPVHFILWAI